MFGPVSTQPFQTLDFMIAQPCWCVSAAQPTRSHGHPSQFSCRFMVASIMKVVVTVRPRLTVGAFSPGVTFLSIQPAKVQTKQAIEVMFAAAFLLTFVDFASPSF